MKFDKHIFENGELVYYVSEHRAIVFDYKMPDETLETKLKFVDEFLKSEHAKFKKYEKKKVLLDFGKFDAEISEYYKKLYPKGGFRENSGRKTGWVKTAPKSDRTARFTMAITEEEKLFLIDALERYRKRHVLIDAIQGGK